MANAPLPDPVPMGFRAWLGATSFCLGLIGVALSWLPPYAVVLNSVGLLCGLVSLVRPSGRTWYGLRFALGGIALSLVGLCSAFSSCRRGCFPCGPCAAR